AAILTLWRQFIEPPYKPGLLVTANDRWSRKGGYVKHVRSAQVESPNLWGKNICIRANPEIVIRSDALDVILLYRILREKLETVRPGSYKTIELAPSLKWEIIVVGI